MAFETSRILFIKCFKAGSLINSQARLSFLLIKISSVGSQHLLDLFLANQKFILSTRTKCKIVEKAEVRKRKIVKIETSKFLFFRMTGNELTACK